MALAVLALMAACSEPQKATIDPPLKTAIASAHRDYTQASLQRALAAVSFYKALGGSRSTACCAEKR